MRGGAVPSRYPAVLACRPSVLAQHSAVPLRQPLILTPPFLSPGSLLRSASRSFHGIDPAGSGEVSRALHGINPVATAEAPVAHRRIAPLLPPKSHVSFAGFAPSRRFARCKKTKIPPFLQLFCDCGLPSIPKKQNRTATQLDHLHFCVSIRNWKVPNNPQSQKSCTASRLFVFEPPGMASGQVWSIPGRQRCERGSARPWGTPSGRSRRLAAQDGLGRSREAAARNIAKKTKSEGIQLRMPSLCFQTILRLPSTYALL